MGFKGQRTHLDHHTLYKFIILHPNPKWRPKWPPRYPPKPMNDHNYVFIHSTLMDLVSIPTFQGAKNTLRSSDIV